MERCGRERDSLREKDMVKQLSQILSEKLPWHKRQQAQRPPSASSEGKVPHMHVVVASEV